MSPAHTAKNSQLLPLGTAVSLVPYSRDYVGRLAREGKIISTQIDKQWFVDRASLVNFYEHSTMEDTVKKKILSQSRKNDLEAKELLYKKSTDVVARAGQSRNVSLLATIGVVVSGLLSGMLLDSSARVLDTTPEAPIIFVLQNIIPQAQTQLGAVVSPTVQPVFPTYSVLSSDEKLDLMGGIILFPAEKTGGQAAVPNLFSDDVTVVMQSTTSGSVQLEDGSREIPFVRVPTTGTSTSF